jgi:hypothetical protein
LIAASLFFPTRLGKPYIHRVGSEEFPGAEDAMGTTIRTASGWEAKFAGALYSAAQKAGIGAIEDIEWEHVTTDATWGDRCGLVFFGASPETCERAAKFFEAWACKNLRKMKVVGGYGSQESIGYVGEFEFSRFSNGARGWHRVWSGSTKRVEGHVEKFGPSTVFPEGWELTTVEVKAGWATSYVYYPGAD